MAQRVGRHISRKFGQPDRRLEGGLDRLHALAVPLDKVLMHDALGRPSAQMSEQARWDGDRRLPLFRGGLAFDWVGTGWLVAENIIVTNRHAANEFAARSEGFAFKMGLNGQISADVDFLQEIDNSKRLVVKLLKPLHIEEPPGPDVAFFEIEIVSGNAKLAEPIDRATRIVNTENVAAIGYPAYDSRIPEPDLMERIYGKIYNKKRLDRLQPVAGVAHRLLAGIPGAVRHFYF